MDNFPEIQIEENDFKKKTKFLENKTKQKTQPLKLESVM